MLHNAFAYIYKEVFKSIVIFWLFSLASLVNQGATAKTRRPLKISPMAFPCKSIVASTKERLMVLGIKGEDIKITENKAITCNQTYQRYRRFVDMIETRNQKRSHCWSLETFWK